MKVDIDVSDCDTVTIERDTDHIVIRFRSGEAHVTIDKVDARAIIDALETQITEMQE